MMREARISSFFNQICITIYSQACSKRPPVYKDHLLVRTKLYRSPEDSGYCYIFYATEPTYKDHLCIRITLGLSLGSSLYTCTCLTVYSSITNPCLLFYCCFFIYFILFASLLSYAQSYIDKDNKTWI